MDPTGGTGRVTGIEQGAQLVDEEGIAGGGFVERVTDAVGGAARPALAHQLHGALDAERIEPVTMGVALPGELDEQRGITRPGALPVVKTNAMGSS